MAETPTPVPHSGGRLRVVVADDNEDGVRLSADLLQMWGHEVRSARCGREALELSESFRPQVLLLDIGMPDQSGYDVARAVRRAEWGKPVLLVALTGWGRPEDKQLARQAGFDHHLTKPVDPDELGRLLSRVATHAGDA
jgi:CheY-like chemotaxis protein